MGVFTNLNNQYLGKACEISLNRPETDVLATDNFFEWI